MIAAATTKAAVTPRRMRSVLGFIGEQSSCRLV
jgi:hypothetical protein